MTMSDPHQRHSLSETRELLQKAVMETCYSAVVVGNSAFITLYSLANRVCFSVLFLDHFVVQKYVYSHPVTSLRAID